MAASQRTRFLLLSFLCLALDGINALILGLTMPPGGKIGRRPVRDGREREYASASRCHDALPLTARGGGKKELSDPSFEPIDSPEEAPSELRGRLTLLAVAFLYGTLNVSLRALYALPNPPTASALSVSRGWLAAFCFLPLFPKIRREAELPKSAEEKEEQAPLPLAALELAFWNFGAQGLLNVGLLFTESARASFLTQTSVVITPLISLLAGQSVDRNVWVGCGAALAGLVLLSDGGDGASVAVSDGLGLSAVVGALSSLSFGTGDLLVLGGALCWSMYIFRTSSIGDKYPEISLQAVKTILLAGLYTSWFVASAFRCYAAGGWEEVKNLWMGWTNPLAWAILAFSALGPGALADVLQQKGQKEVSASEANVILCAEPVFTAILAFLLQGEVTSVRENTGGGLIVLAAVLASTGAMS